MISDVNTSVGAECNGLLVLVASAVCWYCVLQGHFAILRKFSRKFTVVFGEFRGSKFRATRETLGSKSTDMKPSASVLNFVSKMCLNSPSLRAPENP
jgi:hypothetical protein